MSHAISLINEVQTLTFAPVEGAEIKYCKIAHKRYQDIVRECRIDDRGALPIDKELLARLLKELIAEDGTFKDVDEAEATKRLYGLLSVGQEIKKTDWNEVKVRTLQWAIRGWSGIGFNSDEGEAPATPENIAMFAMSEYGDAVFALVLKDVTELRLKAQGISPLERSGDTLNSASTTVGRTAKRASKATRTTTASHPALKKTSKAKSPKASATTHKKSR